MTALDVNRFCLKVISFLESYERKTLLSNTQEIAYKKFEN